MEVRSEPEAGFDWRAQVSRLLPLYLASFAVIMCSLASYVSSEQEIGIGPRTMVAVLFGLSASLFCRLRQWRQNTMFGVMAGMMVVLLFWLSASGGTPLDQFLAYLSAGQNSGPGLMLAWFLVLYSFAMIADEVIIFSIVPSMALLGLMASENPNPEIVIYFLGLVLSAVFLLVYENMLSRGLVGEGTPEPGFLDVASRESGGYGVRRSLLLSMVVMALALVTGFIGSFPLQLVGRHLQDQSYRMPSPSSRESLLEATNRYVNQLELTGAPPRLSDHVVMQVSVDEAALRLPPMYWRGKVFDSYTGNTWTTTLSRHDGLPMDATLNGFASVHPMNDDSNGEIKARQKVQQFIRLEAAPLGGMLVAAGEPQAISIRWWRRRRAERNYDSRPFGMMALTPREDRFRGISVMSAGRRMRYDVESLVSTATPEQLRKAGEDYPTILRALNTRLDDPYDPSYRRQLARQITADKQTPYDKVMALAQYLQDNYSYTLTPPRAPQREDAVTFFLSSSREGYCEIFASALAVMCREIGIPARLATGFAPGEWDDASKVFLVRERDLHAWTEIYFPGYGWVPFDATASGGAGAGWSETFRQMLQTFLGRITAHSAGPLAVLLSIFLIMVFLVKTYGMDPILSSTAWRALVARYQRRLPIRERWDLYYERSRSRLRRSVGVPRLSQTPHEFADQARPMLSPDAAEAFDRMTGIYVDRAYRRQGPEEADFTVLEELDATLRRSLRVRRTAPPGEPAAAGQNSGRSG